MPLLKVLQSFGDIEPGEYLAFLSHSGSRGPGSMTANHYNKIAVNQLPVKLSHFKNLAWLNMDTEEGQEYWEAMNLMGRFASANHHVIHRHIAKSIGAKIIGGLEHHHNHCWIEEHFGKKMYVHRKGATPANKGELGIIPGTMGDTCFIVVGKGNADSLMSVSHGAGRAMSRTEAKNKFVRSVEMKKLAKQGIEIMSCGVDEFPGSYKNIHQVMSQQTDLVEVIGEFHPKIVKMGE